MSLVWEHSQHKGGDLLTLLAIADHADDHGVAYPSIDRLAKKTRMKRRNTIYVLQRLEESSELDIEHNAGPNGVHKYRINIKMLKKGGAKNARGAKNAYVQNADGILHPNHQEPSLSYSSDSKKNPQNKIPPNDPPKKHRRHKTDYTMGFQRWWDAYPADRRVSKPECYQVWDELGLEARTDELVEKLENLKQTNWNTDERKYIKTSLPYLNSGRYEDDLVPITLEHAAKGKVSEKGIRNIRNAQNVIDRLANEEGGNGAKRLL